MRKLCCTPGSPFARKVRIVLAEKGLEYEMDVSTAFSRPTETFSPVNPNLTIPVLIDGGVQLFESNLILEYLLKTYPDNSPGGPEPPLASTMTRPDHHWEDAKTLATLETMANSLVNLRFMRSSGVEPRQVEYLIQCCLDWLEQRATPEGFAPGLFSIMDINLICPLGYADALNVAQWRGRPKLEAILTRYRNRPSIFTTT